MGRERDPSMEQKSIMEIVERLSGLHDLHLPHSLAKRGEEVTSKEKVDHLKGLLERDAAIFLERYGSKLEGSELVHFAPLEGDYSVAWHLKELRASLKPTAADQKSRSALVKNRRLAHMSRLIQAGQYFSEETMRLRAPLLHHEYIGQFEDVSDRSAPREGEKYSETLIRQSQEVEYRKRLRAERQEAGLPEEFDSIDEEELEVEDDSTGDIEEFDSDSENEMNEKDVLMRTATTAIGRIRENGRIRDNGQIRESGRIREAPGCSSSYEDKEQIPNRGGWGGFRDTEEQKPQGETSGGSNMGKSPNPEDRGREKEGDAGNEMETVGSLPSENQQGATARNRSQLSVQELSERKEDFLQIMKEKFLHGEDKEHVDYSGIDKDSTLDDDWLTEIAQDAEEKYFDED